MIQTTYTSTLSPGYDATVFADIARVAERNNRRNGLSGVLLFDGRRFLQIIEGPRDRVARTIERVADDLRHEHMIILKERQIDCTCFLGFGMLSRTLIGDGRTLAEMIVPIAANADAATRAILEKFVVQSIRAAA
jgi:hypothetical protein